MTTYYVVLLSLKEIIITVAMHGPITTLQILRQTYTTILTLHPSLTKEIHQLPSNPNLKRNTDAAPTSTHRIVGPSTINLSDAMGEAS